MSTVRYDTYRRGRLRRTTEAVSGLHFFLMFAATVLLVLGRVEHPFALELQKLGRQWSEPVLGRMSDAAQPLRQVAGNMARLFTIEAELRALERELASMRHLLKRASDLEKRNAELARLAHLVQMAPVRAVTVEVIAGPQGLFGKTVRVAGGRRDGLSYGQPVFNGAGLFGRVVSVTDTMAQVLALNDINSRIAVAVGADQQPALMVGDNSDQPRLVYLRAPRAVAAGDPVVTSGASGEFPPGIHAGRVDAGGDIPRVKTAADLLVRSYLTVLLHELPTVAWPQADATAEARQGQAAEPTEAAGRGRP